MGRLEKMKRIIIEEANKRVLNEGNPLESMTISSIVHNDVDEFVNNTINTFYDVCDKIETDLWNADIDDDGFVYKAQQVFIPEMMRLADEFIEEIKHGVHLHHERIENQKNSNSNGGGHH